MSSFLETLSVVLLVAFIMLLVFLFTGEPDLWDALHEQAMRVVKEAK